MLLSDVRDWIRTFGIADYHYIGRLDNKKEKSIGVYPRSRAGAPVTAIGGQDLSSYNIMPITLLLHWTNRFPETEAAANALWAALQEVTDLDIGDEHIQYLALQVPNPVFINTDENGIYEYVIEFDLYYRR